MEKHGHGIEVCLAVYQRVHRIPEIVEDLKRQTNQNFKLNIWNNSGEKLDVDFPKDRLRIVNSKENIGPVGIFRLAKESKGEIIVTFDDDEKLYDDFIDYQYQMYDENEVRGWFTRIFTDENSYSNSQSYKHTKVGEEVDYVGTGGLVVGRKIFDEEPKLQTIPRGEKFYPIDLYLSYVAKMRGMKLRRIEKKLDIISDDKDSYLKLGNKKDIALQKLRKKGFVLVNENCEVCKYTGSFKLNRTRGEWYPIAQYICPSCGSAGRHRLVYKYTREMGRTLHTSPERSLRYIGTTCDFPPRETERVRMADMNIDLTDIPYAANTFDNIVSNHVIDYIKDDDKAIKELHRVLKKGGTAYITVPIYKDEKTRLMNEPHIGHWWRCGLDYIDKFRKYFEVEVINDKGEYLLICKK